MPFHTPEKNPPTAAAPADMPSQTAWKIGTTVVWNQFTTAEAASLMPFHAALTMFRKVSDLL